MQTARFPVILFDYDDTLGGVRFPDGSVRPGAAAYFDCIDRFVQYMTALGYDGEAARQQQHEIDIDLATTLGFGDKTRFASSMAKAYALLAGDAASESEEKAAYDIGMSVFTDYPYAPLPGAIEVMDILRPFYYLAVITKGEQQEQARKLIETGVMERADYVCVVDRKDDADWDRVLADLELTPDHLGGRQFVSKSWAIGNSVKADVNPLLRRGFNGIHIAEKNGWAYETEELITPVDGCRAVTVTDILDILSHLSTSSH